MDVEPDGLHEGRLTGAQYVDTFVVTNSGTAADFYTFSCSVTGSLTCVSVSPGSATLAAEQMKKVAVTYSVSGPGTLQLTATGHASDPGTIVISTEPTIAIVTPVLTSGSRAVVHNRQPLLRATYLPHGAGIDTTAVVLSWKRASTTDTVTTLARINRGLLEWEVDSTHWLGLADSGLMTVKICSLDSVCATATRWAVLPNDSAAVIGFTGAPLEALGRQFGAPFGPGLAVSGGEVETGIGIPAYVSMGAGHSAGLVYSTRQSYPRALVPIDLELTWPAGTPDQIKVILYDSGGTKLDSLAVSSPTCATGPARRCRLVLQGDFSGPPGFSTPTRKWLTVEARVTSGATTHIATDSVEVVLVDRRTTRYGSGWWPSGALQLVGVGSDRLLVGAGGTAAVFRGNGDSLWVAPPGDLSTLVKVGSGWELHFRGTPAKLVFDSNGRLQASADASGNRDSIAYSGASDQVTAFVDPVGKGITLGYDGNGKLATWTDPGTRQSKVSIDGSTNQLTYDSISSSTTRPFTTRFTYQPYAGTGTLVLTQRIGVIADTTIVTYDSTFKRRPAQVSLPAVDTGGAIVRPVITYTAYERQGFGALRSLDSVYVEMKDPRANWTRSLLNRWGEARKTWDALGTLGRSEYTAEGFVLWTEGKVADSSRVYHAYDALGRPVKSYITRAANDILRLDSLVYDASHRVIKTIGLIGDTSRVTYDSLGRVIYSITPHNDTTKFWYRSDGLLDSTRLPGVTKSRRFSYHPTWKNAVSAHDESGMLTDTTQVDVLGRDSVSDRKIRVQQPDTAPRWQWRRSQAFFNVAGQTDSARLIRTDTCNNPCNAAGWPSNLDTDSIHVVRVRYRFDRAGRDSLRLNDRGKAVLYLYDRLGRVVSRHPWTDSMAVRDSFVYDITGNVKKTITRRGDTLTTNYDSRNRDTLSVIPGVGTLRRAFGGPLDQVTRAWYDSPVDSIGGVNAELRWGFDLRGRLKADTSYTGATVRATSYTYDTYERRSTTTDPVGTWTLRYEASRGYADTLITPFADTITYDFDGQSRPRGPSIRAAGLGLSRWSDWNLTGELSTLANTLPSSSWEPGTWERNDVEPDAMGFPLIPTWHEQLGSGTRVDTLRDSVTYDGWERLTVWVEKQLDTNWVVRDTFAFDRAGNIKTTAGAEVYDVTTDRLTATAGCSSFGYDRAGNLTARTCGANTWTYQYDALNRLRSARYNGTLIVRYGYDVLGRRIAKRVYSNSTGGTVAYTRFVYRGANVGFETDSGGTIGLQYTYGPASDDLLAIRDASGNHFYVVQDKLHSVRGLIKRDGTWMRSLRYGPYGAVVSNDSNHTLTLKLRYQWTGREYDSETGLYFFRARYYDPGVRRFIQEDPIGYGGGGNLYTYGVGPLEGRDPIGTTMNCDTGSCTGPVFNNCWSLDCSGVGVDPDFDLFGGGSRFDVHPDFGPMWGDPWAFLGPDEAAFLDAEQRDNRLRSRAEQRQEQQDDKRYQTCKMEGFSRNQCDKLAGAMDNLQSSPMPECSAFGFAAARDFTRFRMVYQRNLRDPQTGKWAYGAWDPLTGVVTLGKHAFDTGELANTLAHEEYHEANPLDFDADDTGTGLANLWGDVCAGPV
ncbi:MAG: hypothetical protein DMD71_03300 [Gemmatimonadetes bacterium]|nr:MAG: hypothetical protein DMD71_03300 [Gemmatimonadota bacterium]